MKGLGFRPRPFPNWGTAQALHCTRHSVACAAKPSQAPQQTSKQLHAQGDLKAVKEVLRELGQDASPSSKPAPAGPAPKSKGFGAPSSGSKAPKPAAAADPPSSAARPVDPAEAQRGSIDYVKVKSWGSGEPDQLGDLQVERVERRAPGDRPVARQAAAGADQAAAGASDASQAGMAGAATGSSGDASVTGHASGGAGSSSREGVAGVAGGSMAAGQAGQLEGQGRGLAVQAPLDTLAAAVKLPRRGLVCDESEVVVAPTSGAPPPFFDQLAREVAAAEARGALKIAGDAPPPLQQWSFTLTRYLQYLADCHAVHVELDSALQGAALSADRPGPGPGTAAAAAPRQLAQQALQALGALQSAGVQRGAALAHDFAVLSRRAPAETFVAGQHAAATAQQVRRMARDVHAGAQLAGGPLSGTALMVPDGERQADAAGAASRQAVSEAGSTTGTSAGAGAVAISPGTEGGVLAIKQADGHSWPDTQVPPTGRGQAASSAGRGAETSQQLMASHSVLGAAAATEVCQACDAAAAQLVAHWYAVQVMHLAGGLRYGAAAAEKLGLFQADAARYYHAYPASVEEPMDALRAAINKAGELMMPAQRSAVLAALPRAWRSASMLMSALAHTN